MKLATFTWSATVPVPDTFDRSNDEQAHDALHAAWQQVQKGDGDLTDLQDEPLNINPKKGS